MKRLTIIRTVAGLLLGAASMTAFAVQRTFVASYGLDSNACSVAAPCRSFTRALASTDPDGEIIALDSAGYGPVAISQSVSITAPPGVYAGITVPSPQSGVFIDGGARIVLRGLTINGLGGPIGVDIRGGSEIHIEDCVIANLSVGISIQASAAVHVARSVLRSNSSAGIHTASGAPRVFVTDTRLVKNTRAIHHTAGSLSVNRGQMSDSGAAPVVHIIPLASTTVRVGVRDSEISDNPGSGIFVFAGNTGAIAEVTVERTSVLRSASGFEMRTNGVGSGTLVLRQVVASHNAFAGVGASGAGGTVIVDGSAIVRNGTGLEQASSAVLRSCGNNMLVGNTSQTSGAITTVPACNQ